jgi:hypothetical protein
MARFMTGPHLTSASNGSFISLSPEFFEESCFSGDVIGRMVLQLGHTDYNVKICAPPIDDSVQFAFFVLSLFLANSTPPLFVANPTDGKR